MEELKTGPEEVKGKKTNRPISLGKERFSRKKVLKNQLFFRSF